MLNQSMPLTIGALLALAVGLFATISRLDRDRAFYPAVTCHGSRVLGVVAHERTSSWYSAVTLLRAIL